MKSMGKRVSTAAAVLTFVATAACSETATVEKKLPEGEDALSCGALIYAAANHVEGDEYKADLEAVKSNNLVLVTKFGTVHATAKGIDGMQAFNEIKLKGGLMSGYYPGGNELPTAEIVQRAKACAEAA